MTQFERFKIQMVFEMTAEGHGVTVEEVIEDVQAWIDEAWASDESDEKALVALFPNGKPSPEEFVFTVSSRMKEDITKALENEQHVKNDDFPDEFDEFSQRCF